MNKSILTAICLIIMYLCTGCVGDPCDPSYKFYIQNMSDDIIFCQYHYSEWDTCGLNQISLVKNETKILHYRNKQDTIQPSGIPSVTFEDMLFMNTIGDTILYLNPMVDSIWTIDGQFFDSNILFGNKLIYQFYKQ